MRPQNPYDPAGWTGRVEIVTPTPVPLAVGVWTKVLTDDSARLWALLTSDVDQQWQLWPSFVSGGIQGIRALQGTRHILIHNASYPSLVQGSWYALPSAVGITIHMVTARAIE